MLGECGVGYLAAAVHTEQDVRVVDAPRAPERVRVDLRVRVVDLVQGD